jgi:outer membrane protein TolC
MRKTRKWNNINRSKLAAVLGLCLPLVAAGAVPVPAQDAGESAAADLRLADGVLTLSLEEAISIALERNLSLAVERYRTTESQLRLDGSKGIYDVNTRVDLAAFDESSPQASQLDGAAVQMSDGMQWNFAASRLFSTGGTASVTWNNLRVETNSQFALLNPSFNVDFDLSFVQPLMRNHGREVVESGIRVARNNVEISREDFELQIIGVLQLVENAYWSLVEAQAQLEVAVETLELAEKLHAQNRVRVEVGTLAPLELVTSEAGIATRKEEIIRARALVGDGEDLLRQLLNLNDPAVWAAAIAPATDPEMTPVELDVEGAVSTALDRRPELRARRLGQDNLEIDALFRRNQARPELNLSLTYGFNGLGGDLTLKEFPSGVILFQAPGDYGDALDHITGGDFDGWSAALNFSYDIGNQDRKAQRALAEVAVDRGEAELADLELGVITQVRRLARLVDAAAEARESARVSRRLAEKNLDAEQKRYQNGMSTSFQVLEIQEDLSQARSREVNTITGYRKALAQFYQAVGTLIEQSGVEIVEPEA